MAAATTGSVGLAGNAPDGAAGRRVPERAEDDVEVLSAPEPAPGPPVVAAARERVELLPRQRRSHGGMPSAQILHGHGTLAAGGTITPNRAMSSVSPTVRLSGQTPVGHAPSSESLDDIPGEEREMGGRGEEGSWAGRGR